MVAGDGEPGPYSGDAQVAAEAMPYHMRRRTECNTVRTRPGFRRRAHARRPQAVAANGSEAHRRPIRGLRSPNPFEVEPVGVEYLVRSARVTDIDRLVALSDGSLRDAQGKNPLAAADLLRQLVYLPQASIYVAETQRVVVGGAVLALRPSVRAGGFVGAVDLLVVDPEYDVDRVTAALLEEVVRSASNKGCTVVEAVGSDDPAELARWEALGFTPAGPRMQRNVAAAGIAGRRNP
jgi:predicted N-acetyltransferase YhbS